MKKYAIHTDGESEAVAKALEIAGFSVEESCHVEKIISINTFASSACSWGRICDHNFYVAKGAEWLLPSYVIAHAAELDGARNPWEVAPEGCKILSQDECIKHNHECHEGVMYYSNRYSAWKSALRIHNDTQAVAVPADFTFAAEEMTMEQVCKELGRTVKITK